MNSVVIKTLLFFSFFSVLFFSTSTPALADNDTEGVVCNIDVNGVAASTNSTSVPTALPSSDSSSSSLNYTVKICAAEGTDLSFMDPNNTRVAVNEWGNSSWANFTMSLASGCYQAEINVNPATFESGSNGNNFTLDIERASDSFPYCRRAYVFLSTEQTNDRAEWDQALQDICSGMSVSPTTDISTNSTLEVMINMPLRLRSSVSNPLRDPSGNPVAIHLEMQPNPNSAGNAAFSQIVQTENPMYTHSQSLASVYPGNYNIIVYDDEGGTANIRCTRPFCVGTPSNPWQSGEACDVDETLPTPVISGSPDGVDDAEPFYLCKQAGDNSGRCDQCLNNNGIWTAIGCIPFGVTSGGEVSAVPTLRAFISIGLGIAGGVVVIMVLAGAFLLSTSQGDLKRVDEGKALITSAVIGLLFVIFSVTILRFIGYDLLRLPGFGGIR